MDSLLRQLRHSMAELSIQGEDFARQMWQMYAIFEEFLQTHIGWNHSVTGPHQSPTSVMEDYATGNGNVLEDPATSSIQQSSRISDECTSNSPITETNSGKLLSPEMCNPLLETIRIIQNLDQSDDYSNLNERCNENKYPEKLQAVDVDKDSIGYAGSNSIDSGYKSSCPTPDLSDGSCYGGEGKASSCSSLNRTHESKPRIAMGTRVMHRQNQFQQQVQQQPQENVQQPCDLNLDHLMYLRQTLVNAMQQCEERKKCPVKNNVDEGKNGNSCRPKTSQNPTSRLASYQRSPDHNHFLQCAALEAHSRRMPSPTLGARQLRTPSPRSHRLRRVSSPSLSTWHYPRSPVQSEDEMGYGFQRYKNARSEPSVRESFEPSFRQFNAATYAARCGRSNQRLVSTLPSTSQKTIRFNMEGDGQSKDLERTPTKSKPILKDPICANLRAQLELNPNDPSIPMLEEEIDTLLYGKTEHKNVNQLSDIPCSYVTMIEDKYRRSSVARVKKLRVKVSDANSYPLENCSNPHLEDGLLLDEPIQLMSNGDSKVVDSDDMKSRFSEVACCMLEIIEDLQRQKLLSNPKAVEETTSCLAEVTNTQCLEMTPEDKEEESEKIRGAHCNYDKNRLSGADYHVYEEIVYDLGLGPRQGSPKRGPGEVKSPVMPPPLPKRPDGGLRPPGSPLSSASQPKQRLNLYSIFQEQSDRRSIALSLEQEWRMSQETSADDDEYGFKMVNQNSTSKYV